MTLRVLVYHVVKSFLQLILLWFVVPHQFVSRLLVLVNNLVSKRVWEDVWCLRRWAVCGRLWGVWENVEFVVGEECFGGSSAWHAGKYAVACRGCWQLCRSIPKSGTLYIKDFCLYFMGRIKMRSFLEYVECVVRLLSRTCYGQTLTITWWCCKASWLTRCDLSDSSVACKVESCDSSPVFTSISCNKHIVWVKI